MLYICVVWQKSYPAWVQGPVRSWWRPTGSVVQSNYVFHQLFWCWSLLARMAPRCRGAYILPLWFYIYFFFLFFWRLISEVTERISTKLGHIFTYDCYLKNWVRTPPGIYPHGLGGGQNPFIFGTDFELWWNIFLQRNVVSTIGKKLVIYGDSLHAPKFDLLWSGNGCEWLASFCPPPEFAQKRVAVVECSPYDFCTLIVSYRGLGGDGAREST